ncbi:MAG TPA: non-homologous end-joining DNA ligase [Thermomicrobiales bacterium]|nr:non-homologous end-joining DNA ligase [Thermomicrobiales bacterium]
MEKTIDGHEVRLTSLDKVMYPETGFTKADVIGYYEAVADVLLPQLRDRPVTRIRYPDGIGHDRFFEKNAPKYMPEWIRRFTISASPGTESEREAKQVRYPVIDDLAGLLWVANQAALELHTPQYRLGPRGGVRNPDRLVIDLDPGEGTGLDECAEVAHLVADRLREDGFVPVPVTSGGKGLHLYAALDGTRRAMAVHEYVMTMAREFARMYPERIVAVQDTDARAGKVMFDWSQNHPARSTATPYTLRGKPAPTVAAPRTWEEIGPGLAQLGPSEVVSRLREMGDVLAESGLT